MRVRIGIAVALALALSVLTLAPRVGAQGPPNHFTMVFVPDIHYYNILGQQVGNAPYWDTYAKPFITNCYADATWNCRSVSGLGDMVSEANTAGPIVGWTNMAADWQAFHDQGYLTTYVAGNHDAASPGGGGGPYWNTYDGPLIGGWGLTAAFDAVFSPPFSSVYTIVNGNQYGHLDVSTSAGTVKLGLIAVPFSPGDDDLTSLTATANADTDRQHVYTTHMFVSETPGFHGAHPCIEGENDCFMTSTGGALAGAGQWNILKGISRLLLIMNGHSHNDSQFGMHSAQMTGDAGNVVEGFSTRNVANTAYGNLLLARFWLNNANGACTPIAATTCIQIYSWKTAVGGAAGTADTAYFGAPVTLPWTPLIVSAALGGKHVTGRSTSTGRRL